MDEEVEEVQEEMVRVMRECERWVDVCERLLLLFVYLGWEW